MNKIRNGLLAALLLLSMTLLAACGEENYEPQAINEETDICVICKMAVKDNQYATQIVTKDGQALKFDDIGCLNEWKKENGNDTIGAAFVRDYHSKQWLKYEKAYYAYDSSYKTPMAYGIVSFEKEADAQAFIDKQGAGKLMTAQELDGHSWEVNRDMMDMGGMDGHSHGAEGDYGDDKSGNGAGDDHDDGKSGNGAEGGHGDGKSGHGAEGEQGDDKSGHGAEGGHGDDKSGQGAEGEQGDDKSGNGAVGGHSDDKSGHGAEGGHSDSDGESGHSSDGGGSEGHSS
ncbi:hypothetical protein PAECIP111893_03024 [Paenibacillus plantiphilus]|uniref:Copper chaperone NosL n=1 Tax=Paenibacillus plantiphilus TaxID=2905650 RepID=A0ABN8GHI3_9BACL|nr:nitrous oxide reductase accessory protein NosL [Paenibacillus plantiphilus]CAH1209449.1 hypothetical protein PAECIP111893_03024 [Paenibacillus plantiphilus]